MNDTDLIATLPQTVNSSYKYLAELAFFTLKITPYVTGITKFSDMCYWTLFIIKQFYDIFLSSLE